MIKAGPKLILERGRGRGREEEGGREGREGREGEGEGEGERRKEGERGERERRGKGGAERGERGRGEGKEARREGDLCYTIHTRIHLHRTESKQGPDLGTGLNSADECLKYHRKSTNKRILDNSRQ